MNKSSVLILEKLKEIIFSEEIISKYKMNKVDFTRNRKQTFGRVLLFMLNLLRKSLVIEIDNYINQLHSRLENYDIKSVTSSAFVQRRMKINPDVFKYLSSVIVDNFYIESNKNVKHFKGFRVLAVDGSRIALPCTNELKEAFGEAKNQTEVGVVQARASVLYDVLNHLILDSTLANVGIAERELALTHSEHWKQGDLIIYDRGYPSFDFKYEHNRLGVDYLIRVSTTYSKVVKSFVESKKKTSVVVVSPQVKQSFENKNYDKNETLRVRLVRVDLPGNEVEVLITSLLDSQEYPGSMFKELYFLRWGVEIFYDELKNKLKLEYFTGYSKTSILQDFYCAIFVSNIQSIIVNDIQEELDKKSQGKMYAQKVNTNLSYGFLKNRILELLWEEIPANDIYKELKRLFIKNTIPIRNNRSNLRQTGKYNKRIRPVVLKNQKDAI